MLARKQYTAILLNSDFVVKDISAIVRAVISTTRDRMPSQNEKTDVHYLPILHIIQKHEGKKTLFSSDAQTALVSRNYL